MKPIRSAALAAVALAASLSPAAAEKAANPVAVFTGLDKITGRIITFDVYIDETVQFGALRVTPRVCYTRPPTESAQTDAFVEVEEITLDSEIKRIFTGWMFAASPGLNAVEHPVYDVWLNDCRLESDVPPPDQRGGEARTAKANEVPAGEASAVGGGGVQMVGGIPIPPEKPAIVPMIDSTEPDAPTEESSPDAPDGQILD